MHFGMYDKLLGELVSELKYKERMNICKMCDKFINLTKQCGDCFCFLPIKARVKIATCPQGKWK